MIKIHPVPGKWCFNKEYIVTLLSYSSLNSRLDVKIGNGSKLTIF